MENLELPVLSFDHESVEWNEEHLIHVSAEILVSQFVFCMFPVPSRVILICVWHFVRAQSLISFRERGLQRVDELEDVEEDSDRFNNLHPSVRT